MGRMRSVGRWTGVGLALLALSGCARLGISTGGGSTAASPDGPAAPQLAVGDVFTFEDNGVPVQEQVMGFAGPRAQWQNDRGVSWVQSPDVISPPISWSGDPRLGLGTQQVFGDPSKLFPLEVGKNVKFQVAGVSEKLPDGWQAENSCTVIGKEPVTVKAGTFQTWRIGCQRGEVLETIYYAPDVMTYALRTRERPKEPPYEKKELVAFDLAQAPDRKLPAMAMAKMPEMAPETPAHGAAPAADMKPMAMPAGDPEMANRVARLEAQVAQLERMASLGPGAPAPARPPATTPMRTTPAPAAAAHAPAPAPTPAPAAAAHDAAPAAPAAAAHGAAPAPAVAAPAAEAKPMAMAANGGGNFGAHLGSYRTVNEAKHGWEVLAKANPDILGPLHYQTAEFDPGDGRGVFIRLLAGPFERGKANELCKELQGKKVFCRVLSLGPA